MGRLAYKLSYETVETILNQLDSSGRLSEKLNHAGKNYVEARFVFETVRYLEEDYFEQVQDELDERYTKFLEEVRSINKELRERKGSTYQIPTNPLNISKLLEGMKTRSVLYRRIKISPKTLERSL